MSLPSGFGSNRRRRVPSFGSYTGARVIPGSSDSQDGASNVTSDTTYGSLRGNQGIHGSLSSSHREPTRSSVHLSYRGALAPIDSALNAQSVREDTAELASYALSDRASARSTSPRRSAQTHLESFFSNESDSESFMNREAEALHQATIPEVSEPASPENSSGSDKTPGTSVLSNMLKTSPPSTSPPQQEEEALRKPAVTEYESETSSDRGGLIISSNGVQQDERAPLLGKGPIEQRHHPDWIHGEQDLERQEMRRKGSWPKLHNVILWYKGKCFDVARNVLNPKKWDRTLLWNLAVVTPVGFLPAVILGLLLNILDALSYGMILFPLGQPTFAKLGPAGISMFYISCIISQLAEVALQGGLALRWWYLFFHKMAFTIQDEIGEDNPNAIIATTITAFALSSILTGLVFYLMGKFHFGYIVGFIPRHILTGCIGGVGWFLIATGFEVSARLNGNLNYDIATLSKMFEPETLILWIIPFTLGIGLYWLQQIIKSKYLLPGYILTIPAIFYFFVLSLNKLDLETLTNSGWIFEGPESGQPWWYFYTLYDFKIVHWAAILKCLPSMIALTFFGVLHVPINVPSLAYSVGEDNLDLDRELRAHGLSNALSGCAGSIQNYLVYANSTLFYKSGGDSRVAGVMLAGFTCGVLIIGPDVIGLIPVMMVGTLIFDLGFELFLEAVWVPRKKLKRFEYLTVVAIVVVMGAYDFVAGIGLGILLAFVSFVVNTSRIPAIRASYSGEIVRSTVRRNPTQHSYLLQVGEQIHVTKLAGYLFFGTIVSVEERIRALVEGEAFNLRPIRFLVLDLWHVTGIDYSAAEAFNRLNRVLSKKDVTVVISGVDQNDPLGTTLRTVGLGNEVGMFPSLNSAVEMCENELLKTLYSSKNARSNRHAPLNLDVPGRVGSPGRRPSTSIDAQFSSPRRNQLARVASTTLDESPTEARYQNFKEPLRLILQTFQGLTDKNEDFWFRAIPCFVKKEYLAGTVLFRCGEDAQGFYLLEEGILRADYDLPQGKYYESIVAGTTCGELPFFSDTSRTATVQAERDCVTWLLDRKNWDILQKTDPDVARELLMISLKLTSERMSAITSYVLTTAG
ncbi:Uncharacterized protein LSUB1_G000015 [Lachnellula subtilissima]|uniref:Sulfate transporter n=1 Tax=Lachnellula subtilissima TaxID=602034 RepID=A0A8H8S2X5_9HELO|nr:Uncharacterized protein LSUB1_G000015 [Lachnellula subtilissima]